MAQWSVILTLIIQVTTLAELPMSWSTESIVAFVTLLVTLPPSALLVWTYLKRRLRGVSLLTHSSPGKAFIHSRTVDVL